MSKKVYAVVVAATTGVVGVAEALVDLFNPPCAAAIAASLPVLEAAVITIANNFVVDKVAKKK
jgi:hypothetical protein